MTKAQIEAQWVKEGGNPAAAPTAAAIALAESSGNPTATNVNTNGSIDRGLFQINSVHGSQSTYNLEANVRSAIAISNDGANWTPWVTYNTGAYKQYLGTSGVTGSTQAGTSSSSSTTSSSTSGGSLSPGGLTGLAIHGSLYLGFLVAGVALLWIGTKTAIAPRKVKP